MGNFGIDCFNQTLQHGVYGNRYNYQAIYRETPGIDKWAPMSDKWWRCIIESRGTPSQLDEA